MAYSYALPLFAGLLYLVAISEEAWPWPGS
jgi:hypothetical protein